MTSFINNNIIKTTVENSSETKRVETSVETIINKFCIVCNEYYSTEDKNNKCSYCFYGKDMRLCYRDKKFRIILDQYIKTKLASKTHLNVLKKSMRKKKSGILRYMLKLMIKNDTYITAKFCFELKNILNKMPLPEKENRDISYIICSLIIDWWNMKDYSFTPGEMCYFGHFGDKHEINEIKTIPPPLNNRINTLKLFKIIK